MDATDWMGTPDDDGSVAVGDELFAGRDHEPSDV
jgi:hypothetical protein